MGQPRHDLMQPQTVVFYDGVCGLCDRLVQFLLRRDRRRALRFATLQGELARRTLPAHGVDPSNLDSVVVLTNWDESKPPPPPRGYGETRQQALTRSRAVLHTLRELGGGWRLLAQIAGVVPDPLADIVYKLVARSRYRIFGRFDRCQLPPPDWKDRFLE